MKMLVWSDYACSTGFAQVMSNILKRMPPTEDFSYDVVGVNYLGNPDYDHERFPGNVWTALSTLTRPYNDLLGRQKVLDLARENNYDTVFILQDLIYAKDVIPKLIELRNKYRKWFKIVYYFPVDSPPQASWVKDSVALADIPVAYTEYGKQSALAADNLSQWGIESKLQVVPHGVDLNDFYPIEDRSDVDYYRNFFYPGSKGKFLLVNVNRNQPRKDIPRSLLLLDDLRARGANVAMYLHLSPYDVGGEIAPIAAQLELTEGVDYFLPKSSLLDPASVDEMNMIYNMADAVFTTSLGEGWGLSLTEAMATKTLVIAPKHTSITEILKASGYNKTYWRGVAIKAGDTPSHWTCIPGESVLRPMVNVESMAYNISHVISQDGVWRPASITRIIENAYKWVTTTINWDTIVNDHWSLILDHKSSDLVDLQT